MRADFGTENCTVAKIHIALRINHDDSLSGGRSFIYGPSTANTVSCNSKIAKDQLILYIENRVLVVYVETL